MCAASRERLWQDQEIETDVSSSTLLRAGGGRGAVQGGAQVRGRARSALAPVGECGEVLFIFRFSHGRRHIHIRPYSSGPWTRRCALDVRAHRAAVAVRRTLCTQRVRGGRTGLCGGREADGERAKRL